MTLAAATLLLVAIAGCAPAKDESASAVSDRSTPSESHRSVEADPTRHGPLTLAECPDAKASGIFDHFADTRVEPWQEQAARYVRTTLVDSHPDATTSQITDQTADGLEVSFFKPTGQRVARHWFSAYKGGWRLETTEECASPPPSAEPAHY